MSISAAEDDQSVSATNVDINEDEPIIRKVFIAHVNSYQGKAVAKKLPDIRHHANSSTGKLYEIYGSLQISDEIDNEVVENYAPRILDRKKATYMYSILECEVIVFDIGMHNSQVAEAQKALDMLENKLKNCQPDEEETTKYFILISTPMVWARTPPVDPENPAESLTEADYRKRRSHPCYLKHQYLEREVINAQVRHKGKLRTVVVCPGVTYGGRNEIFHYMFKKAFYNRESVDIYQSNVNEPNYIPMVYINDFAQMVFNIIEQFPPEKIRYIFAVQPKPMSLKTFGVVLAKSLAGNPMKVKIVEKHEILSNPESLISQRVYHYLSLNLKVIPTFFADFPFTFSEDNYEEMGNQLADEYRKERNLLPIKIIVDGPPCAGKTTLCKALAEQYEVHYIDPSAVVYNVIKSLEQKINETKSYLRHLESPEYAGDFGEEAQADEGSEVVSTGIQSKRELSAEVVRIAGSLQEQLVDWEAELADLTEYLHSVGDDDEMEFEYIKKCLVEILSSKPCSENQGYVIDGFPFDYTQTAEIFPTSLFHPEEGAEEEMIPLAQTYTHSMKPNFFITLVVSDDILCKRAMSMTEREAVETKNTEELLLARLAKYRESTEEDVSCANYFSDNDVVPIIIKITADLTPEQVLEIAKKQIGPPHTYPLTRSQMEEIAKNKLRVKTEAEEAERKRREQIEREEAAAKEQKLQEWTQKFEQLKQQEQEVLEAKSLPLRSYLCKYVLPTLTEGLLRVAEVKPDDPIDFLAEYLFKCNPSGHVLDPAYSDDAKRLLLSLNCDAEQMASKPEEEESRNDNLECDDSFINRNLDLKGSYISLKKKHIRSRKSEVSKSSSSSDSKQQADRRPSKKSDNN